MYKIMSAPMLS